MPEISPKISARARTPTSASRTSTPRTSTARTSAPRSSAPAADVTANGTPASDMFAPADVRFADYVKSLPHTWLFEHLVAADGGERRILSSAMLNDAVAKFTAKTALQKRFKSLSDKQQLRCAQTYLSGDNGIWLAERASCGNEPLLAALLTFAGHDGGWWAASSTRLFGFREFEPALRSVLAETLAGRALMKETAHKAPPPACPWRPLNDVVALCSLAAHGDLTRSPHGGFGRSAQNTLKKLTHDPTISGKSVADGEVGHPAGFLAGYCFREGLLGGDEEAYHLNAAKFRAWLKLGVKERLDKMYAYAYEFSNGFAVDLMREILDGAQGRTLAVNPLFPEINRDLFLRVLGVFEFLGFVQVTQKTPKGAAAFVPLARFDGDPDRMMAETPPPKIVVMPDYSVIIPQEISPSELFEFSKIGRLKTFDSVYKGEIAKDSVSNSLAAENDPEQIREWLRTNGAAPNVMKTVDEWMRVFMRLFVLEGSTLVSTSEKVTEQIMSLEPMRKCIKKIDAHAVFAIRKNCVEKVFDMLERLDYDTRGPVNGGGQKSGDPLPDYAAPKKTWKPLADFASPKLEVEISANKTKYSAGLRKLDPAETMRVADYAMVMNLPVAIEYSGSVGIPKGVYTTTPAEVDRGIDPCIIGEISGVRGRKHFLLERISRIGVLPK